MWSFGKCHRLEYGIVVMRLQGRSAIIFAGLYHPYYFFLLPFPL